MEWNKCETIKQGVQELRNICESKNNKRTIKEYGCRREIPMERSGPECITFWFGIMFQSVVFDVQSCVYLRSVECSVQVMSVVRVMGHNTVVHLRCIEYLEMWSTLVNIGRRAPLTSKVMDYDALASP